MIDLDKINKVNWENTNIAILGAGISGIGAAKLAIHLNATVLLSDVKKSELNIDKSSHLTYEYSGHSDKVLKSDLIIKSPGIPNEIDIIKKSKRKNIPIVSEIEFASWFSNSEIIAVTGSNGKTTTVNIIFEIFKEAAENVLLGGNVGTSYSENVLYEMNNEKDFIHILEISSYQAEYLYHFSPKISCILNISEDHMDRYKNMSEYIDAKLNISKNLNKKTKLIYNYDDMRLRDKISPSDNVIPFSINKKNVIKYNEGGILDFRDKKHPFKTSLFGIHNFYNILAAIEIANLYNIDFINVINALKQIPSLPHRIQLIDSFNNVQYIDDSKSTTIASTIAAVKCFQNIILILGGKEKGDVNKAELLRCINHKHISNIIVYGDVSLVLENILNEDFSTKSNYIQFCYLFKNALRKAVDLSFPNSTILLSPGFSSFDQFNNYEERGNAFKKIIKEINYDK